MLRGRKFKGSILGEENFPGRELEQEPYRPGPRQGRSSLG